MTDNGSLLIETFNLIDVDGNGFITRDEVHRLASAILLGYEHTEDDINSLAELLTLLADANGDGVISFEEYCNSSEEIDRILDSIFNE